MHASKYFGSFFYYILILIFLFSLAVNLIDSFPILNSISYVFLHYLIIYLGLYYHRKKLYIVFFFCGLGLDLFLINQIGPHLFVFMSMLLIFNQIRKTLQNLNTNKIYVSILLIQTIIILLELFLAKLFFNYDIDINYYFKLLFISIVISYPIFLIFSKIDSLK